MLKACGCSLFKGQVSTAGAHPAGPASDLPPAVPPAMVCGSPDILRDPSPFQRVGPILLHGSVSDHDHASLDTQAQGLQGVQSQGGLQQAEKGVGLSWRRGLQARVQTAALRPTRFMALGSYSRLCGVVIRNKGLEPECLGSGQPPR